MPKPPKGYRAPRAKRAPSKERDRFSDAFVGVLDEFEATLALARQQRELLDAALKTAAKTDPSLKSNQHIVWMSAKTGELVTKLMREGRQLQKQYAAEDMSEAESFQILIDAGWRPPAGWKAPDGVVVPADGTQLQ